MHWSTSFLNVAWTNEVIMHCWKKASHASLSGVIGKEELGRHSAWVQVNNLGVAVARLGARLHCFARLCNATPSVGNFW